MKLISKARASLFAFFALAVFAPQHISAQGEVLIDSYNETNQDATASLDGTRTAVGQVFVPEISSYLHSSKFYLSRENSPAGLVFAKLYAVTGIPGSTATPSGVPLAISAGVDASTLSVWPTLTLVTFNFTPNTYLMLAGTPHAITVEYAGGSATNTVPVGKDNSGTHPGNKTERNDDVWEADGPFDTIFYVYGEPVSTIIDSYSESNQDGSSSLNGARTAVGQVFTPAVSAYLRSVKFYISKENSPTGTVLAKLYAVTGLSGSTAVPVGAPLAISAGVNVSTLSPWPTLALATFDFTPNVTLMSANIPYAIAVEYSDGSATNTVPVGKDQSGTHAGNYIEFNAGVWGSGSAIDTIFYVYGNVVPPKKRRGQITSH